MIPTSLLDPVGTKAASYWPLPALPGLTNNLPATAVSANPLQQITAKVDHNFSSNKRGFIRYGYLYNVAGSPNYYRNLADVGFGPMTVHAHNAALGYTQTLGTATVLELRAGINRFSALRPSNGLGYKLTTLGCLPAQKPTWNRATWMSPRGSPRKDTPTWGTITVLTMRATSWTTSFPAPYCASLVNIR